MAPSSVVSTIQLSVHHHGKNENSFAPREFCTIIGSHSLINRTGNDNDGRERQKRRSNLHARREPSDVGRLSLARIHRDRYGQDVRRRHYGIRAWLDFVSISDQLTSKLRLWANSISRARRSIQSAGPTSRVIMHLRRSVQHSGHRSRFSHRTKSGCSICTRPIGAFRSRIR
jgi:hypothetical protein